MNVTNRKDLNLVVLKRNLLSLYIEKGLQSRRCVLIKEEWAKAFGLTIQDIINNRPAGTHVVYQCGRCN